MPQTADKTVVNDVIRQSNTHEACEKLARDYYPECWEGRFSEALSLLESASRMKAKITDSHLIDWKRGRGPWSTEEMESRSKRQRWLGFANRVLALRAIRTINDMDVVWKTSTGYEYLTTEEKISTIGMMIRDLESLRESLQAKL